MSLYGKWCTTAKQQTGRKRYWRYTEKTGGRRSILPSFAQSLRSHYDRLDRIAEDVARLGYELAAKNLKAQLPQTKKGRSGDLGEILATEFVEEEIQLRIPVRRLRYKDGRNMAMRGDDFIGVAKSADDTLHLLKGEAKSNKTLGKTTIENARRVLNRDSGRCTPDSLMFVANRLLESADPADQELGRAIRDEVALEAVPDDRIAHMLFTFSGNHPPAALAQDLTTAAAGRDHYVVNLHVEDHQEFIQLMYEEAQNLGDD